MLSDPSGLDAKLSVDQTTRTITYSTTYHFYGTAAEVARMRTAAARTTQFFRDNSGTVDIDGTDWTVNYNVAFQFHTTTAASPTPAGITGAVTATNRRIGQMVSGTVPPPGIISFEDSITLLNFNTARTQTSGFNPGDNIVTFADIRGLSPTLRPAGVTVEMKHLPTPNTGNLESTRSFIALDRTMNPTVANEEYLFRTLTHEIGHTLGFGERYGHLTTGGVAPHPRFQDDFMGNVTGRPTFNMHSSHREASARFAIHAANGQSITQGVIRNFSVDDTGPGGSVPQFTRGALNPAYTARQTRLQRTGWSRFRRQFAPPPPTPRVQLFPRPDVSPIAPIQILPQYNYEQTTPIIPGTPQNTITILRWNF